jgi:hypothetical protein
MELKLDLNFQKPKDFQLTKTKFYQIIAHTLIYILGAILISAFDNMIPSFFNGFIIALHLSLVLVIIMSLADYLDLIRFRAKEERFTKCTICGRSDKVESYEKLNSKVVTKVKGSTEDSGSYSEKTTVDDTNKQKIPASPFHGIIIFDKTICNNCITEIQNLRMLIK